MTKDQNQASAMTDEKWLVVDGLVYSLRDGANYNEINVSMVDGSRATADRNALANRIAAILSAATPAQQTEAPAERCQCCGYLVTDREHLGCLRAGHGNAALHKDAERYRALRDSSNQLTEDDIAVSDSSFNAYFGEELDAAVDAFMARNAAIAKEAAK